MSTESSFHKKYFAKYLPVEGEIKEGDRAIDENIHHPNNIVTITFDKYKTASDGRGTYSSEGLKKLKRVKLFLCTRDIQIGDIARWVANPKREYKVGVTEKAVHDEGHTTMFKVIGEISPEATWVKEGMEFDESTWRKRWYSVRRKTFLPYEWENESFHEHKQEALEKGYVVTYIQIKGPRGHFH